MRIISQPTLELHLQARRATKDGDSCVMTLVHERAEHGAGRGAVRIAHWIQRSACTLRLPLKLAALTDGDLVRREERLRGKVNDNRADIL